MAADSALTAAEVAALHEALDDEYRAVATYEQVIQDFGDIRPFTNIVDAERRHIGALVDLFSRYGLPIPDNPWHERAPTFATVAEACAAGVAAEIDNAEMYDRLLAVTGRPDIRAVLSNLRRASQDNHLPAFQRCQRRHTASSPGAGGGGQGRRRRRHGRHDDNP